jgi:hypothetical protein
MEMRLSLLGETTDRFDRGMGEIGSGKETDFLEGEIDQLWTM